MKALVTSPSLAWKLGGYSISQHIYLATNQLIELLLLPNIQVT